MKIFENRDSDRFAAMN